ncbi:MAG: Ig-like domain-containing protein [Acidobacteriota bacterium]
MRGLYCRGVRLKSLAILGMALALPAWAMAGPQATQTRITAEAHDTNRGTQAAVSVKVTGLDGSAATGAVVIEDGGKPLAGAAVDANGTAQFNLGLLPGDHSLRAVYMGDASHEGSNSDLAAVSAATAAAPGFKVSVNPGSMTLTAGQSGHVTVSITPVNASSLTAPMFVGLSCSGFPDQSSCSFTPTNIEILPNTTAAVTSDMVISTQAQGTRAMAHPAAVGKGNSVAWAILLPGVLGLGGLAFGARRRRWLQRLSLIALVGLVSMLGMTACSPRYWYFNRGPFYNLPTPSGSYTLQVTAQSSNGVTATTQSTSFALTVQ